MTSTVHASCFADTLFDMCLLASYEDPALVTQLSVTICAVFWSFHNLEPSKLEGCRLALRRCVEARCQDVECLSTLSVLCLVVALSDCIIISDYSDGELLLTRIHISFSFPCLKIKSVFFFRKKRVLFFSLLPSLPVTCCLRIGCGK